MADFTAASAGALADITADSGMDPGSGAPLSGAGEVSETPAPQIDGTPESTPVDPMPVQPTQDWELKWNGKTMKVAQEEAIKLAQQGFDYTQKAQTIAEEKRQIEAQRAEFTAERQRLSQALADPAQVKALYDRLLEASGQNVDPNEITTQAQMRQALQQEGQRVRTEMEGRIQEVAAQTMAKLEVARMENDYTQATEMTLGQLVERHDIFKAVDGIETLLRQDAWNAIKAKTAMDSTYAPSKEDIQGFLVKAAEGRAAKMSATIKDHEKMAVARQAKLTSHGTEPPGGRSVTPMPGPKLRLGSKELTAAALEDISRMMRASTS
jgi:hypothetical protein